MRTKPLVLALLLACTGEGLAVTSDVATAPAEGDAIRALYIVEFVEPPVATFRGDGGRFSAKLAGLKATSPAVTGHTLRCAA